MTAIKNKKTGTKTLNSAPGAKAQATPAVPPTATPPATSPDPNAALAALVTGAITQLDALDASLGVDPTMTPIEKRHAPKMRKGGAAILGTLASLATQHGVESSVLQVEPMTANMARATALAPLANRLASLSQHVNDLIFEAQGSAWETGLQFYALLQRTASTDTALATALQPVKEFFAYRHKTAAAAGTPTKAQKRATKKAVTTLQKTAPSMLSSEASEPSTESPAPSGTPQTPSHS